MTKPTKPTTKHTTSSKPTPPERPTVIIPPPPPTPPKATPAALIAATERTGEHAIVPPVSAPAPSTPGPRPTPTKPLRDALRMLLASSPTDIATCTGMTPERLAVYIRARHVAEAVLTED